MTRLYSGAGHLVEPGKALGRGGEGAVHDIVGRPGFVAKIYHQAVGADKALKLEGMARQAHPSLLEIAAWPVDVLRAQPTGPICGFVMPKVSGYQEIHSLYGPAHRKRAFPQADWSFLVHAARNLASAFETIHARGHVIGDVNPGNVVISAQALVKLIDCDSFQIDTGNRLFPCDVGVPQFTAPELQDRPFHGLRRTPDHDAFGLALLCFHLLFMGRHPFAGRYRGKGDMPIERAIKEYRFAFGQHAAARSMESPPHTLPFTALPHPIAHLFERAFAPPNPAQRRPSAREWLLALEQLGGELRTCRHSALHKYPQRSPACPWCTLEQTSGTLFFVPPAHQSAAGGSGAGLGDTDLEPIWNRILAVEPPTDEEPPAPASTPLTPITPHPATGAAAPDPPSQRAQDGSHRRHRPSGDVDPPAIELAVAAAGGRRLVADPRQRGAAGTAAPPHGAAGRPPGADGSAGGLATARHRTTLRRQAASTARTARAPPQAGRRIPTRSATTGNRPAPASVASVSGGSLRRCGPDCRIARHRPNGAGILRHRNRRRRHPGRDPGGARFWSTLGPAALCGAVGLASDPGAPVPLRSRQGCRQSDCRRQPTPATRPTTATDRTGTAGGSRRTV
ncbi:hypothetical protein E4P82_01835 [Candidatus Competibacter phosphatis]|uniref:Protein kinase domain-containing protein n=1 Tax=Candidatus Competibacter phosphatis TaxID=221280 RepID=A0ABX1TJJ1_9GAMM|nr:hypothetical protein [Candidatus Competibacter phosphatis]